jgi:PleD family two-component response regulator
MPEPKRILLVDDERSQLDACRTLLTNKGYIVHELSNPGRVLKVARELRPVLIFMGHNLPGFRGTYAVQMLKGHELLRMIPVIYFSAHKDIKVLAAEAGADAYLVKPLDGMQLIRVTQKFTTDAG